MISVLIIVAGLLLLDAKMPFRRKEVTEEIRSLRSSWRRRKRSRIANRA